MVDAHLSILPGMNSKHLPQIDAVCVTPGPRPNMLGVGDFHRVIDKIPPHPLLKVEPCVCFEATIHTPD